MEGEWKLDEKEYIKCLTEKKKDLGIRNPKKIIYYSQQDEDKYIIQYFLKQKLTDGTYLEAGACDGIKSSNTKTLEDFFGFRGILIEPQDIFFENLKRNRGKNNECYNYAITCKEEDEIEFWGTNGEGGVKETLRVSFDTEPYKVKTRKLSSILKESKFAYIDFMSIDVEGHELEFLKSIDFSFPIFCIIIEAASDQEEKNKKFGVYLQDNGFSFRERQRGNEIWINHSYFRKKLFNL